MSADPLADLLAEMEEACDWADSIGPWSVEAEWLRTNRGRVLRLLYPDDPGAALKALGGKKYPYDDTHSDMVIEAADRRGDLGLRVSVWVVPEGPGDEGRLGARVES